MNAIPVSLRSALARVWLAAALISACLPLAAIAEETAAAINRDDPTALVQATTDRLLAVTRQARDYAAEDPERYYAAISGVLDPVLDMDYFARGVMATYAGINRYRALQTDAERAAFRARITRFAQAIRRVLFVKYADALLSFEGERIEVAPAIIAADDPDQASVVQTIYDSTGKSYKAQYSLHRVKSGEWRVYNVIVEGINMGQIYRSQFAEAVEHNGGDIDYVVDHWVDMMLTRDWKGNPEEGAK
ncbi:MAG: phospholipid-binding protein MlaC [Anaerolineae bacterium]